MTNDPDVDHELQRHYTHGGLAAAVDQSLRNLGKDPAHLGVGDLAQIDEFHIGGHPASIDLFAKCGFTAGIHLLDVGSGLGGPARACAVTCGARVSGVDLTPEYVALANDLSARLGLSDKTTFQQGSVLDLAFAPATFDGAYMIHVGMNISDKSRLFGEVRKALKVGATFGIYDVMRRGDGGIAYPMPWSSSPATSFVETPQAYKDALVAHGFEVIAEHDKHKAALDFFADNARRAAAGQLPALTHRGPGWNVKSQNLAAMLQSGILGPTQIIARAV